MVTIHPPARLVGETKKTKKWKEGKKKYKLLCPRGTQTCALAVANIAHAVYLLDVAKRPIPQG